MRYFTFLVVLLFLVLLLCGYFFVLAPKNETITTSIKQEISDKEDNIKVLDNTIRNFTDYINAYNSIDDSALRRAAAILPEQSDEDALFLQMDHLMRKHGYKTTKIDIKKEDSGKKEANSRRKTVAPSQAGEEEADKKIAGVGRISINISVEGMDYEGFKRLLNIFENNLRLMDLVGISYNEGEDEYNFEISTYYLKDNAPAKS